MQMPDPGRVTRLLERLAGGDADAVQELVPLLYSELRGIAEREMALSGRNPTLRTTALVHEAYLRLVGGEDPSPYANRQHFLSVAARAMRQVLVDHARRRSAQQRGGDARRVEIEELAELFEARAPDLIALDLALEKLQKQDEELARLVELRFFAGLSVEEIAQALGVSGPTVKRRWQIARAWLQRELDAERGS